MQLHGYLDQIAAKGGRMHLIGNGGPSFIEGFRQVTGYGGTIYSDPSLEVYNAAGLLRSVRATIGLRSIVNGVKNLAGGQRQGSTQGDTWQQGGALVINSKGQILYSHRSSAGGDNASAKELIDALE